MPKKSVKKEKTSKRSKGDIKQKQIVKVSVKIGETKPKRKRVYRRKTKTAEGTSDLARPGETRTLYGSIPPQTITIQQQPQLPSQFQQPQQLPSITSGDVEKAKQNLLEGIEKQTQEIVTRAVAKAQGAEQRAELARIGWIEPVSKTPTITETIETTAPTFSVLKDNIDEISKPMITEISTKKKEKSKPKLIIEDEEEVEETIIEEPPKVAETKISESEKEKRNKAARERKSEPSRAQIYDEILSQYGFPAIRGDMSPEEFSKKIISIFEAVNSGAKKRVSKKNIENYYGQKFSTIEKYASKSKIPVKDIEAQPIATTTAQAFNLLPVVEAQSVSSSSGEAVKMV